MPKKVDPATLNHMDLLGKRIELGSVVAATYYARSMSLCKVVSVAEKSIRLRRLGASEKAKSFSRYPGEVLLVDSEDLTMYILRKGMK